MIKTVTASKVYMGRLSHGSDLLQEITDLCIKKKVKLGRIEGIGAVQKARMGYFNQAVREYRYIELNQALEITMLVGNISIKDNTPFVHAHITLSDEKGKAFGGHLAPGTEIYACEIIVHAFEGPEFIRSLDKVTALPLWHD